MSVPEERPWVELGSFVWTTPSSGVATLAPPISDDVYIDNGHVKMRKEFLQRAKLALGLAPLLEIYEADPMIYTDEMAEEDWYAEPRL